MSMNTSNPLQPAWLQQAIAQGLLPAQAQAADDARPWPVVLLTALGAWFAGIFLLIAVGLLVGKWLFDGAGGVFIGPMLLAATVFVLRQPGTPLFVEQLFAPMLWVAGAVLGLGLGAGKIMGFSGIFLVLALVCGGVAMLLPRLEHAWLRLLLGASMAVLLMLTVVSVHWTWRQSLSASISPWLMLHLLMALWCAAMWLGTTRDAWLLAMWQRAHAAIHGWGIAVLVMFMGMAGQTFLLSGAAFGGTGMPGVLAGEVTQELTGANSYQAVLGIGYVRVALSAALAVLAGWLLVRTIRQRQLASDKTRTPVAAYGVALVMVALASWLTNLGGVFLMASVCLAMRHHKLAALAGFAAAWIIGSFYYSLALPLATKALVLAVAGAALALLAWWAYAQRTREAASDKAVGATKPWLNAATIGIIASAVLTLGVANYAIAQKETLIRDGKRIYIPLAPRDPRSLMQGDYMALNFSAPAWSDEFPLRGAERPHAVGKLNAQGVLELTRLVSEDAPIPADEIRVQLTAKNGSWTVVTDAWFFAEGDAQRWEAARFGEFRVLPDGRALLVGMADEKLQAIHAGK